MNRGRPLALIPTPETAGPMVNSPSAIIEFGRRWSPYGGGPAEDIMVEFGWTTERFFTELEQLLSVRPPADLPASVVEAMIEVCRRRIWMGQ